MGDRDFAANVSIKFHTPEEFFLGASPEQGIRQFDPKAYIDVDPDAPGQYCTSLCAFKLTIIAVSTFSKIHPLELVIFCGSPGAGKSTFYWKYLKPLGYERVNQDLLKTVRHLPSLYSTSSLTRATAPKMHKSRKG
jgi:bifunctional polynucleotide phosphatase/kinase